MEESEIEVQFAIDSADGKELIQEYLASGSEEAFERFFWVRVNWCGGYPLVHDRFVTYGAFEDFLTSIGPDKCYLLLPKMLQLAETVPDSHFHCALHLLMKLIPDDRTSPRPAGFSDSFLRLRLRAEKLSFLPNLERAWDQLAEKQRYLEAENDPLRIYTAKQLGVSGGFNKFFSIPLPDSTSAGMEDCRATPWLLDKKFQELGAGPDDRQLFFVTQIEGAWYWVWRLPGKVGTAHLARIVFLRQPVAGDLGLGYWDLYQQFPERDTPREISLRLLKIEFQPHLLDFFERENKAQNEVDRTPALTTK